MKATNTAALLIGFAISIAFIPLANASRPQESQAQQQDKDKPTPEKKAVLLLDQVLGAGRLAEASGESDICPDIRRGLAVGSR